MLLAECEFLDCVTVFRVADYPASEEPVVNRYGFLGMDKGLYVSSVRECSLVRNRCVSMAVKMTKTDVAAKALPNREGKVRKEFWLNPSLLRRAQKDLGAATEREAVEIALSLVTFRGELSNGVRALRRLRLSRID